MAVTNYYLYPVGGTTPPSVVQAAGVQAVYAQVLFGDTDVAALVTHNFGVTQPEVPSYSGAVAGALVAATAVFPVISVYRDSSSTGTVGATIGYSNINSVAVAISKASVAGSNLTLTVAILRPFSAAWT